MWFCLKAGLPRSSFLLQRRRAAEVDGPLLRASASLRFKKNIPIKPVSPHQTYNDPSFTHLFYPWTSEQPRIGAKHPPERCKPHRLVGKFYHHQNKSQMGTAPGIPVAPQRLCGHLAAKSVPDGCKLPDEPKSTIARRVCLD